MLTLSARNRSKSKRDSTPKIDELLESIGLIRHVVPRDGNSLFRCISQCVFLTQSCHTIVRQHLLTFSTLQTQEFSLMTQMSVSKYKKKITDTKLDGELLDMYIAAKLYKITILFYADTYPFVPLIIDTPNSVKTLNICLNYENTYDLVLLKESVANVSFCQAIIYKMLYNNVFKLSGVDFAVKEMLFDRNLTSSRSNDRTCLEKRATCTDMKKLLEIGITPFPFKVAKALTPKLYRNTEYDIWLNNKKEKFYGRSNNWEFKEGSKCMVLIGNQEYHCYIQCIRGKNEAVEVYVKDLAQKMYVGFNQLKLLPFDEDNIEIPIQLSQVSSTINDGNEIICQVSEESDQYYNQNFIHRPISEVLPGQTFPSCYVEYQQQSPLTLSSINNQNIMHPWYTSTPPPILQNEQIVMFEPPTNLNKTGIPPPNLVDNTLLKLPGPHIQPIPSSWYCNNGLNTLCKCGQCNNSEESDVLSDSNCMYQPWPLPECVVPENVLQ